MRFILFCFCLFCLYPGSKTLASQEGVPPSGLLCELLSQPELSVITNPSPKFSWVVNSGFHDDYQTAFQIIVADSRTNLQQNKDLIWDSEKVISGQSSNIQYQGGVLLPHASYWWMVRTWNRDGIISGWSKPQRFNTGDFNTERLWPGESKWVEIELENSEKLWTFENRHPVLYHEIQPAKRVQKIDLDFFDFGRAAFAVPEIKYTWKNENKRGPEDTIWVFMGERSVGDSIDREPGGGVLYRKYPLVIKQGTHREMLELPRFAPRYPHSQAMPVHMPEVIPFRYVEIQTDNPGVVIEKVTQHALYYLFDENASYFYSSDQRLNDVYNLCRYSVKANTFNGDYAASERERMLYEADAYIHQISHYAVDREYAIARYSLENLIFHATWPTEWILHTILMAYADYWQTGNSGIIEKYFSELSAKLMLELASDNYLISTRIGKQTPGFLESIHFNGSELRDIVDWPHGGMGLDETGGETDNFDFTDYNTVVNAFHYRALVLMAEMAEATGRNFEAERFNKRASKVFTAFNKAFFDQEKNIYVDGIGSNHSSLHANMFALVFGLVEEDKKPEVIAFIKLKGMACGVYGANYLLEGLFNEKETEYAIGLLTNDSDRSWINMLRVGSTMTTEAWDNKYKSNNGWSHAWSASPAHIIPRKILGIEPLIPGFGEIRIAPQPGNLQHASCKLPTIKGPVLANFSQKPGDTFSLNIEIPANTKARVILPDEFSAGKVTLDGEQINPEQMNEELFIHVGSGKHSIQIKY